MHFSAETEIRRAVVRQDRAVERHLAANRNIGIAVQHFVAQQIEWMLRSRHVGTNHVKWRVLQPVQDLTARRDDDFQIYLRLLKKKIITVVLDTDHKVHYDSLDPARAVCRSYTARVAEVENAGSPKEKVVPPDTGMDSFGA